MVWFEEEARKIFVSKKYRPFWVDDMKTPSGRIHVGALRGVIIHDLIYKSLKKLTKDVTYSYIFNSMDPMDGFPNYLDSSFRKYMGCPLFMVPSPKKGFNSLAQYYAEQFINVFNKLGAKPIIIWSDKEYKKGKFNKVIKEALDNVGKIRKLYKKISHYDKPKNWYPFQVICPNCGKIGTTIVTDWDGERVSFECRETLVTWAKGCGYKGKMSPFNGNGKFMWKVDWPAHWKTIGITIEWSGKDHMTEGGSYDLSSKIVEKVFNYSKPYAKSYEWFLTRGGVKMSSSKGIGVSASEISQILPPEILRFLLVKTHFKKTIIFDPSNNETILKLFDDYDAYAQSYYQDKNSHFAKIWENSQVKKIPKKISFIPRFRLVVNYIQSSSIDIFKRFTEKKGKKLTIRERNILKERIEYAKIWIKTYAPKKFVYQLSDGTSPETKNLSPEQKKYLINLGKLIQLKNWQAKELQQAMYDLTKKLNIPAKKAFQALYLFLIGKTHGPKAAWFILENKEKVIKKLKKINELDRVN